MIITMKMITVIAVAAVVVGATAGIAYMLLTQDDGPDGPNISAGLEVYGNADGDWKIDENDINIIQKIIDGELDPEDYPLADANQDGIIDEKDIEHVRAIMNASPTNRVEVFHINHHTVRGPYVASTMYPITSAVSTGASNTLLNFKYLGIVDQIHGLSFNSPPDSVLFYEYTSLFGSGSNLGQVSGGTTSVNNMDYEKVVALKLSHGVQAIVTADNNNYVNGTTTGTGGTEAAFEAAGIDVVRIKMTAADPDEWFSALLMMAFLFDADGTEYMDKCLEMIIWYQDLLADIDSKVGGLTDSERVSAIASSSDGNVSSHLSDFTDVLTIAGAKYPSSIVSHLGSSYTSTVVSYKEHNNETWLRAHDVDKVINIRVSPTGTSWYGGTAPGHANINNMMTQFDKLQAYENNNVYIMSGDMPVMLRIAYAAEILYPDLFGEGYADSLHVDFADRFLGFDSEFMEGKKFVITMADLGLAN